uniref:Uncharacterized protein n=1 Tax=Acrobeloides nanus TaxID=290746 RepID=A0A914DE10_9BILA
MNISIQDKVQETKKTFTGDINTILKTKTTECVVLFPDFQHICGQQGGKVTLPEIVAFCTAFKEECL